MNQDNKVTIELLFDNYATSVRMSPRYALFNNVNKLCNDKLTVLKNIDSELVVFQDLKETVPEAINLFERLTRTDQEITPEEQRDLKTYYDNMLQTLKTKTCITMEAKLFRYNKHNMDKHCILVYSLSIKMD